MRTTKALFVFTLSLLAPLPAQKAQAEEPISAVQFLKAMQKKTTVVLEPIFHACREFQKRSATLPPKEAAKQWIDLLDQYIAGARQSSTYDSNDFNKIIEALPPPETWQEVAFALKERKTTDPKLERCNRSLRILAALLEGNNATLRKEIDAYDKDFKGNQLGDMITPIRQALDTSPSVIKENSTGGKTERILSQVRDQIKKAIANGSAGGNVFWNSGYALPDLVSDINVLRTMPFLKEIFTTFSLEFTIPATSKTFPVAQRVAREQIDQLKSPQWSLAHCIDNIDLYEAMERRFPPPKPKKPAPNEPNSGNGYPEYSYTQRTAQCYYILSLALKGKTEQALQQIETIAKEPENGLFWDMMGRTIEMTEPQRKIAFGLLRTALSKNPNLGLWRAFMIMGVQLHQITQQKSLVLQANRATNLHPTNRSALDDILYLLYLESDQVEDAVKLLKAIMARPKPTTQNNGVSFSTPNFYGTPAQRLITLGQLYQRPEWIKEGAQYAVEENKTQNFNPYGNSVATQLIQAGRPQEALNYLWNQVKGGIEFWGISPELGKQIMMCYHALGRYGEVLVLLDRFPGWQVTDLAQAQSWMPIKYFAADALAHAGRNGEAVGILQSLLPELLAGYSQYPASTLLDATLLLARLQPDATGGFLDKMLRLFPDTPALLLGRAIVSQKQGKLAEAEQLARKALNRQRYAPMFEAKTVVATLHFLENLPSFKQDRHALESLRNTEKALSQYQQARQWQGLGVLSKAHPLYQEATALAPDWVAFRWAAGRLSEQIGATKIAETHCQRLAELQIEDDLLAIPAMNYDYSDMNNSMWTTYTSVYMPSAQINIAIERACKAKLAKEPNHPQAHYLLGYKWQQSNNLAQAYQEFEQAAKAQPKHALAWQQMYNIASASPNQYPNVEELATKVFALEPVRSTFAMGVLRGFDSLPSLWKMVQGAQPLLLPEPPESLYVLTESKHALESQNQGGMRFSGGGGMIQLSRGVPTPGQAITQHKILQPLNQLILSSLYPMNN